jgi:hypothetical protein
VQLIPFFAEKFSMWDEQKRQRFQQLRERECQLTAVEEAELGSLVKELKAAYLSGATERLRQERDTLEKHNRALEDLAIRRKALVERLSNFLTEAHTERRAIESELASVLASSRGSNTED